MNSDVEIHAGSSTHEVTNQTPALSDYNLFTSDPVLMRAVMFEGASDRREHLTSVGAEIGAAENFELARQANQNEPVLHAFDANGVRIDRIEFHPAWHQLMSGVVKRRLHTGPWAMPGRGAHLGRAAAYLMQTQIESGTLCPTTMTYGAIPAMSRDAELARTWLPTLLSDRYDPRDVRLEDKQGGLIGMGMTEKQGGSDVRANTTRATATGDGAFLITGHKWFYSAPQCDAHLVLAQSEQGISCFFVPRFLPDGSKNRVLIQRLKDKLGNRSNASSEVEFDKAYARPLGEPGRGIPTILEMGTYTRLDCVTGTSGLMRQMVALALHHGRHRSAFGKLLGEQPLMQQVLADLCLESAAATVLSMRLARAYDAAAGDETEQAFRRVMTPAAKFWVCKRGPELAAEAMEVFGGNGYVEDFPMARIYREMPVNSIWEGSGNIMCLDVLRALSRGTAAAQAIEQELVDARGREPLFDGFFLGLMKKLAAPGHDEAEGRHLAWQIVIGVQAALLIRGGDPTLAEEFCRTRLSQQRGSVFGSGSVHLSADKIFRASWDQSGAAR
jgi:putative acyl-CoA dehydrogenase